MKSSFCGLAVMNLMGEPKKPRPNTKSYSLNSSLKKLCSGGGCLPDEPPLKIHFRCVFPAKDTNTCWNIMMCAAIGTLFTYPCQGLHPTKYFMHVYSITFKYSLPNSQCSVSETTVTSILKISKVLICKNNKSKPSLKITDFYPFRLNHLMTDI